MANAARILTAAMAAIHDLVEDDYFDISIGEDNYPLLTVMYGGPNKCPPGMVSNGVGCGTSIFYHPILDQTVNWILEKNFFPS